MRYLLILAVLITGTANATKPLPPRDTPDQNQSQVQNQSVEAYATGEFVQGNQQSSTHSSENNVTFTSPDDITVKRTVAASAPSIDPSHACALTVSGGAGFTGGGVSFGKAYIDPECNARETARLFYQFGEREKAIMLLCAQPSSEVLVDCQPYQDYNKEMQVLRYGHDKLVTENTALREQLERSQTECEAEKSEISERATETLKVECAK